MEDTARLAVFEQKAQNTSTFEKTLVELLEFINYVLSHPHDRRYRVLKSELIGNSLKNDAFTDYLNYIGFDKTGDDFVYPMHKSLGNLRMAQAAVLRKLKFLNKGSGDFMQLKKEIETAGPSKNKIPKLQPSKVLATSNNFLLNIQNVFNSVMKYEDEDLQKLALTHIPIVSLQLKAIDRLREHQLKLKRGDIEGKDLSFDVALLVELVHWFKNSFFEWVDRPRCTKCGGDTQFKSNISMNTHGESCRVEVFNCAKCNVLVHFPRYNNPGTLLTTRRGRCGEWANCFTLLCRALRYDTRYVYDTTDHVWCEVYDGDTERWLHVDPCEAVVDKPLIYENGWGKELNYIVGFSRDDLQDVTWRYSSHHKQLLGRRNLCTEAELLDVIVKLRTDRQLQVSEVRRKYLVRRSLVEIVQLMVERKPSDYEQHGRLSGSADWRQGRGELGTAPSHTFALETPGLYTLVYSAALDKYTVSCEGRSNKETINGWHNGVFKCNNVFRKEEKDWKMAYVAREDGGNPGSMSWKLAAGEDVCIKSLSIQQTSKLYENGDIRWTIKYDDEEPMPVLLKDSLHKLDRDCTEVVIEAELSGGKGAVAYQHAQLFRQPLDSLSPGMELQIAVVKRNK